MLILHELKKWAMQFLNIQLPENATTYSNQWQSNFVSTFLVTTTTSEDKLTLVIFDSV